MGDALGLLTEEQAAAELHCSQRFLRKLRAKGAIAYVRVGRTPLYTIEDLRRYIDIQRLQVFVVPAPKSARRGKALLPPMHDFELLRAEQRKYRAGSK